MKYCTVTILPSEFPKQCYIHHKINKRIHLLRMIGTPIHDLKNDNVVLKMSGFVMDGALDKFIFIFSQYDEVRFFSLGAVLSHWGGLRRDMKDRDVHS